MMLCSSEEVTSPLCLTHCGGLIPAPREDSCPLQLNLNLNKAIPLCHSLHFSHQIVEKAWHVSVLPLHVLLVLGWNVSSSMLGV